MFRWCILFYLSEVKVHSLLIANHYLLSQNTAAKHIRQVILQPSLKIIIWEGRKMSSRRQCEDFLKMWISFPSVVVFMGCECSSCSWSFSCQCPSKKSRVFMQAVTWRKMMQWEKIKSTTSTHTREKPTSSPSLGLKIALFLLFWAEILSWGRNGLFFNFPDHAGGKGKKSAYHSGIFFWSSHAASHETWFDLEK